MQNSGSERRRRAVRLTEEALQLLNGRLLEVWRRSGQSGRLTKAGRADLMNVSSKTADRIVNRAGNDRMVLIEVFVRVGLDWKDEFCEPCREPTAAPPSAAPRSQPDSSPQTAESAPFDDRAHRVPASGHDPSPTTAEHDLSTPTGQPASQKRRVGRALVKLMTLAVAASLVGVGVLAFPKSTPPPRLSPIAPRLPLMQRAEHMVAEGR